MISCIKSKYEINPLGENSDFGLNCINTFKIVVSSPLSANNFQISVIF